MKNTNVIQSYFTIVNTTQTQSCIYNFRCLQISTMTFLITISHFAFPSVDKRKSWHLSFSPDCFLESGQISQSIMPHPILSTTMCGLHRSFGFQYLELYRTFHALLPIYENTLSQSIFVSLPRVNHVTRLIKDEDKHKHVVQ